ncbi:MAG: YdcF family protein [Rhodospirillaceae bacterium]|nr:YdcF family protein [Rhodospirillales bacterium]
MGFPPHYSAFALSMRTVPVESYDAAIILGAKIEADGTPSPAMARRVAHGVDLLHSGRVRALLMTGGATTTATPEAWTMRQLALEAGVPFELVHVEDRALNTIENALFSAPLVRAQGWGRLVVVTDSFHLPRARYIFRRFGLAVDMSGARPEQPSRDWWLAHLREAAAIPWTILRVERALLRR